MSVIPRCYLLMYRSLFNREIGGGGGGGGVNPYYSCILSCPILSHIINKARICHISAIQFFLNKYFSIINGMSLNLALGCHFYATFLSQQEKGVCLVQTGS